MYSESSVVGKASTIGIEISSTPPLITTGGQQVRNPTSFSTWACAWLWDRSVTCCSCLLKDVNYNSQFFSLNLKGLKLVPISSHLVRMLRPITFSAYSRRRTRCQLTRMSKSNAITWRRDKREHRERIRTRREDGDVQAASVIAAGTQCALSWSPPRPLHHSRSQTWSRYTSIRKWNA